MNTQGYRNLLEDFRLAYAVGDTLTDAEIINMGNALELILDHVDHLESAIAEIRSEANVLARKPTREVAPAWSLGYLLLNVLNKNDIDWE